MASVKYRVITLVVLLFGLMFFASVSAQSVDRNQCELAQNYLRNIQKPRDLRGRVDRLQAYQYIYQRMDNFVSRLERNKQPEAENLRANLQRFSQAIEQFKGDYESYDTAREAVVKISDCQSEKEVFDQRLAEAREKRVVVKSDIELIQSILNPNITSQLESLYQQLLATTGTEASRE